MSRAFVLPFVSQRLTGLNHAPHEDRTTDDIAEALSKHGIEKATFVGHSLGTIYLAWLVKALPRPTSTRCSTEACRAER